MIRTHRRVFTLATRPSRFLYATPAHVTSDFARVTPAATGTSAYATKNAHATRVHRIFPTARLAASSPSAPAIAPVSRYIRRAAVSARTNDASDASDASAARGGAENDVASATAFANPTTVSGRGNTRHIPPLGANSLAPISAANASAARIARATSDHAHAKTTMIAARSAYVAARDKYASA